MKDSKIIKTLMTTTNNKSQVTLMKRCENFRTNLLKICNKKILHTEAATTGVLHEKDVLKSLAKSTGKHLCKSLFNFFPKIVNCF